MFTEEDYIEYFEQLENILKKMISVYTDLLNELNDNAIKSKLDVLVTESMASFRFIHAKKDSFR